MDSPEAQLKAFLGRYLPGVAATGRASIRWMRTRLPGCDALVYDNYQALAVGFSPDGRTKSAPLSIAVYPRWVSLFFLQGAGLKDPDQVLIGEGSSVRHVVLSKADDLDLPVIRALIDAAVEGAPVPYDPAREGSLVIKSVSARQRPRRPG